jgi:hypothetical protein
MVLEWLPGTLTEYQGLDHAAVRVTRFGDTIKLVEVTNLR